MSDVFILGGAQTDFARNFTREGKSIFDMMSETVDAGLLRFNLLAKIGHHATQFRDHGCRMRQLPAEVVHIIGRRHAGFKTAP